jgi:hypothetical protein
MEKSAVREMVVQKVSKELYLDEQFVIDVMNAMEEELGDELYGRDTIAEVVARILDIMDDTDENWESDKTGLPDRGVKKVNQ